MDSGSSATELVCTRAANDDPRLPPELLQLVIESVLPANPRVLLPTSHSSARTLLALTRVSRLTYKLASKLLRLRCLYLDSERRLANVLLCMNRLVPTLPPILSLRNITSLYLAPFAGSLDNQPTAMWVRELFCEVCNSLRRLVVHMPFGSLDLPDDHLNVRRTLRDGFEQLTRLEEFVCLGEYPALSVPDRSTDVWHLWPDLRRLVLFNVPADSHWLWWYIATHSQLTHVVLARPQNLELVNIKDEYFHKLPRDDPLLDREIKVVLVGVPEELPGVLATARWREIDRGERMTVERYEVPTAFYDDETPEALVTSWVRRAALNSTLWGWGGDVVEEAGGSRLAST